MTRIVMGDRSKYNNRRAELDGYTFDSQAELRRYQELRLLEVAGEIRDIHVHRRFPCRVGAVVVCTYIADFSYRDEHANLVVEDVKGSKATRTQVYMLKKKLMQVCNDIMVREVYM